MISRKAFVSIILAIAGWFISGSFGASAQTAGRNAVYRQPSEVRLARLIRRRFPDFYGKSFPQEELIVEKIYPVGWSKDGKLAYYLEPGDEACGCYFAKLVIKDLKSDAVLWQFDYDSSELQDTMKRRTPESLPSLWRFKRELFASKLREHRIIPQRRFALLLFPASHMGDRLDADLKTTETRANQDYGIIKGAVLQLASQRKGRKTVFEQTYGTDEALPLDMKVLGYFKSPFEPRIAVVLIYVWRGYEGPPHVTHFQIVGASLDSGFR